MLVPLSFLDPEEIKSIPPWTITLIVQNVLSAKWMAKENTSFIKASTITHVDTDKELVQDSFLELLSSNLRDKCLSEALKILYILDPLWMKLYIFYDN